MKNKVRHKNQRGRNSTVRQASACRSRRGDMLYMHAFADGNDGRRAEMGELPAPRARGNLMSRYCATMLSASMTHRGRELMRCPEANRAPISDIARYRWRWAEKFACLTVMCNSIIFRGRAAEILIWWRSVLRTSFLNYNGKISTIIVGTYNGRPYMLGPGNAKCRTHWEGINSNNIDGAKAS